MKLTEAGRFWITTLTPEAAIFAFVILVALV